MLSNYNHIFFIKKKINYKEEPLKWLNHIKKKIIEQTTITSHFSHNKKNKWKTEPLTNYDQIKEKRTIELTAITFFYLWVFIFI